MHDLKRFRLSDALECGAALRTMGEGSRSMEHAAQRIVRFLYDEIVAGSPPQRAFALVRLFKTHPAGELDSEARSHALSTAREPVSDATRCMVLLGTAGDLDAWNRRQSSASHHAIPLTSEAMIAEAPMISRLLSQFGVPVRAVIAPDEELQFDVEQTTFSVFHVEQAAGSPWIPAQTDFVLRYGIQSVLGFGGLLYEGTLFAVLMFSKVAIPKGVAEMFGTLALNVKAAIQPFGRRTVFEADGVSREHHREPGPQ